MADFIGHADIIGYGGAILGGCEMRGREGTVRVLGLSHSTQVIRGLSAKDLQGFFYGCPRRHGVFSFAKAVDRSSPALFQALSQNTPLFKVVVRLYRYNGAGHEEHYYTITLENVLVRGITLDMDLETVSFAFETISWRHETAGREARDTWQMMTAAAGLPVFAGRSAPTKEATTHIDLSYQHDDGRPVAGAAYTVVSTDRNGEDSGDFAYSGRLGDDGRMRIEGVPLTPTGTYRYFFGADPKEFEVFETKQPVKSPDAEASHGAFYETCQWIWKTLEGDFNKDQSTSQIAANTLLGLIPFVDQALDLRDVVAGLIAIVTYYTLPEEERNDTKRHPDTLGLTHETFLWLGVFLIAIGCIPILGSAVKGVFKGILKFLTDNAKRTGEALSLDQARKLWESCLSILNYFGKGNAHRFLKDMPGKLSGWMDEAETLLKNALDQVAELLAKAKAHAERGVVKRVVPAQTLNDLKRRIKTLETALNTAAGKLPAMKASVNDTLSTWVDTALSGKHRFEKPGRTGRSEARVQAALAPPTDTAALSPKTNRQKQAELNSTSNDSMKDVNAGHPVNTVTGAVVEAVTDFTVPGRIPLVWERHYRSQNPEAGLLGPGWQCPADARLTVDGDGTVIVHHGGNTASVFDHVPVKTEAVPDQKNDCFLHQNGTHYIVIDKNNISRFFEKHDRATPAYLERISDSAGNYLLFRRDHRGLREIEDSAGRRIRVFSEKGRIRLMVRVMPDGSESTLVRYEYDHESGDLIAAYDASGHPLTYEYDNHCLTRLSFRSGLSFNYAYDRATPEGKCLHTWGDDGLYDYRFEYHEPARQTRITNSLGHTEIITRNDDFRPVTVIDHAGHTTFYTYTDQGKPASVKDPLGRTTTCEYDSLGNLTAVTRPDGTTIRMTYDGNCNPVTIKDPNGNVWRQRFEDRAFLTHRISPLGAETRYAYNKQGDLVSVTAPNGGMTRFDYDGFGHLSAIIHADGSTERFDRDPFGNIVSAHDPLGRKTGYVYDEMFRLIRIIKPSGGVITCDYDVDGRLIRHTDEAGHETRLEYTGLDQIKRRINPDGTTVHYHYDTEERLKTLTNERGEIYEFRRDHAGRITHEIDYWGNERRYTYDPAGQLLESIDPLNRIIRFKTDVLGRLIEKAFDDGKTETFAFDANGNLVAHENEHARTEMVFDLENRLVRESFNGQTTTHEYDVLGNRTRRLSALGNDIRFDYDILGRTTGIAINGSDMAIARNALGLPVKETFFGGTERTYDYTADNQLAEQVVILPRGNTIQRSYEYDPVGNLTARIDADKGSRYFTYNPMGRITKYTDPEQKIREFLHDPAGDLFKRSEKEAFDGSWHLDHDGTDYHFNAAGNLIERTGKRGHHTFTWDTSNRLTAATNHATGAVTTMAYDAQGRRLSKATGNNTTTFLWDGDQLLSDNVGGNKAREFVYYPGSFEPLAIIDNARNIHYVHTDSVGLPQEVTNTNGDIVWSAAFDAQGSLESLFENHLDNPLRFQGQYYDPEIDLSYNRYRYFDAQTGSFVSQDPLGLAVGDNVYDYSPNVWRWIDPLGLCKENANVPMIHPFTDGGSHITTSTSMARFPGSPTYGGPDGLFVAPKPQIDELLSRSTSRSDLEVALGLEKGQLSSGDLIKIDVNDPLSRDLKLPTSGNKFFRPGTGLTTGGLNEGVIKSPLKLDPGVAAIVIKGL
jgi:type VI secretion system Hcp family effector